METVCFESYEAMLDPNSLLRKQFPDLDIPSYRGLHYFELLTAFLGCVFYTFYFIIFAVHGKTFFVAELTFYAIFMVQILSFGSALIIQKFSFVLNSIEYATFASIPYVPNFVVSVCDKIVIAQMPMYWFTVSAFLIIQVAQFSNQNPRSIRLAHIYLAPIGIIVFLVSLISPVSFTPSFSENRKSFPGPYETFNGGRVFSDLVDLSQTYGRPIVQPGYVRQRHFEYAPVEIWLSCQAFATLMFHLLELGVALAIKSSVMDSDRQIYYEFYKKEVFRGILTVASYLNAFLFSWSTIDFVKKNPEKEITTLPVFVNGTLPMESMSRRPSEVFSRRPSAISAFSLNNVSPLTPSPRDANMLHI
ncbi:Protein CBG17352 [Caenorhabditis briggsae]|uniref:Protein CBG17352 n=1 Tax=Caenorhabditis briggsae TaxID=6238 RepID=A8XQV9_CAEBR|nr:Protein CBG17352 [Caenorhabditis briggsae]CAP35034.2 Protein CBG17352 [Caenorhabditis briggsae]